MSSGAVEQELEAGVQLWCAACLDDVLEASEALVERAAIRRDCSVAVRRVGDRASQRLQSLLHDLGIVGTARSAGLPGAPARTGPRSATAARSPGARCSRRRPSARLRRAPHHGSMAPNPRTAARANEAPRPHPNRSVGPFVRDPSDLAGDEHRGGPQLCPTDAPAHRPGPQLCKEQRRDDPSLRPGLRPRRRRWVGSTDGG